MLCSNVASPAAFPTIPDTCSNLLRHDLILVYLDLIIEASRGQCLLDESANVDIVFSHIIICPTLSASCCGLGPSLTSEGQDTHANDVSYLSFIVLSRSLRFDNAFRRQSTAERFSRRSADLPSAGGAMILTGSWLVLTG
jgi:hypothetical protein